MCFYFYGHRRLYLTLVFSSFMQGFISPAHVEEPWREQPYHIVMDLGRTLPLELQHNTDVC